MNRLSRAKLAVRYRQAVQHAVDKVLSGATRDELKNDIDEINYYGALLDRTQRRWTPEAGIAIVVAFVCLLVAGFLWEKKVPFSISLQAETEGLHGELQKKWHADHLFQSQLLRFERLCQIDAPNLGVSINNPKCSAWVRLEGGQISVQSLQIDEGASVEIVADHGSISLAVGRRPMRGTLTVLGKGTITAGSNPQETAVLRNYDLEIPETLEFVVNNPGVIPSRLTVESPQKWTMGKVPFGDLNFAVERNGGEETYVVSGIRSGKLDFYESTRPSMDLSATGDLALHHTTQSLVEVQDGGPLIHVTAKGAVQSVALNLGGYTRELQSSYLEYLYSQKAVSLFWGAVACVWGVMWGIRRTIFR